MTLSFESLKLLHIYLLLLIIRSGLIYWHDAHIYLFITFTRMIWGLFISRTEGVAWELELSFCQINWPFFCHGFNGSTAASEALFLAGKLLTQLTEEWKWRAITGWQRHGWQWVDLPFLILLQSIIFFLMTNFVFGCKMDVSWVVVKRHCLQDWMLNSAPVVHMSSKLCCVWLIWGILITVRRRIAVLLAKV